MEGCEKHSQRGWGRCFRHRPATALVLCGSEGCKYPAASGREGFCSRHGSDEDGATPGLEEEKAKLGVEEEVEYHGAEDVSPSDDNPANEERA